MRVKLAALLASAALAWAQSIQSPSLQQYLTARQVGAQQMLSGVAYVNIPPPTFGTQVLTVEDMECHYGAPQGGSGASAYCGRGLTIPYYFTVQEGENMVDWIRAAGFTHAAVNVDLAMFVDATGGSATAQYVFTTVMSYAQSVGLGIILKPSYTGSGTNTWTACGQTGGQSITSGSATGTHITFNMASTPGYAVGETVTVAGTTPSGYDGTYIVSSFTGTSVTVSSGVSLGSLSGGTMFGQDAIHLAACVTTPISTLLIGGTTKCTGDAVGCSPVEYLANVLQPVRFTVVTEPTTQNGSLGLNGASTGSGTDWAAYGSTLASQVVVQSPNTKIGFALSRFDNSTSHTALQQGITAASQAITGGASTSVYATVDVAYTGGILVGRKVTVTGVTPSPYNGTYVVTSVAPNTSVTMTNPNNPGPWSSGGTLTSPLNYAAYDVYSDDPGNTINGLGLQQQFWQSDQAAGLETIWGEMWVPSWSPGGMVAGGSNSYEGQGNCDWNTYGINRLSLTSMSVYASSQGMTELDMFSGAYAGVVCIYQAPNNHNDCTTCAFYELAVANALTNPAQRSPLFYVLQSLIRWFPLIAPGIPLPI